MMTLDPNGKRLNDTTPKDWDTVSLIEQSVCNKIITRAKHGRIKYNATLERDDLTVLEWLRHAQEEAMDLANYLEVIINKLESQNNA